ncbi:MAG: hypothetical protein HYS39_02500, partial [Proteobacteria bacterium]|nr:hypothetical protein [Pseudomonadota bacterium]
MSQILIDQQYLILQNKPLPEFNTRYGTAFAVEDQNQEYIALIVPLTPLLRLSDLPLFKRNSFSSFQNLLAYQTIPDIYSFKKGSEQRQLVFILQKPIGQRLSESIKSTPLNEIQILKQFLPEAVAMLEDLEKEGLTHRAIHPFNIFYSPDSLPFFQFGECFSELPGTSYHPIFDPYESALCAPSAKGTGTLSMDLYSLGCSIIVALLGHNPWKNMDLKAILEKKAECGSYDFLVKPHGFSEHINELLKGLLADYESKRWLLKDLKLWLSGSKIIDNKSKTFCVMRPFKTPNNKAFFNLRSLTHELRLNPNLAKKVIFKDDLQQWIRSQLQEPKIAHALATFTSPLIKEGRLIMNQHLTYLFNILDPINVITINNNHYRMSGLRTALSYNILNCQAIEVFEEIIRSEIIPHFLSTHDYIETVEKIDYPSLAKLLNKSTIGHGLERCLYFLNPYTFCHSSIVLSYKVFTIAELLQALEKVASAPSNRMSYPIDRHIIAFIIENVPTVSSVIIHNLNHSGPMQQALAMVQLLADLQEQFYPQPLVCLYKWLVDINAPLIKSYKNLLLRQEIMKAIDQKASNGNLKELAKILDNKKRSKIDEMSFRQAKQHYQLLELELKE